MERLSDTAIEIINGLHTERLEYASEYIPLIDAANLLAAYEDTGLTPEEIERVVDAYGRGHTLRTESAERLEIVREIKTDRLRELAKAEKDGRLVVLPCKVGAPVYTTHWWKDVKEKCTDSKGNSFYRTVHKNIIKKERFNPFGPDYEWLGKTVFLTREEAEAALAKEGDSEK